MINYESCRTNLEKLISDFNETEKSAINEANTRFKFIDSLLTDCLNWEKTDISCEDSYEGKYTDYIVSVRKLQIVATSAIHGDFFYKRAVNLLL